MSLTEQPNLTQAEALHWILVNRRAEVPFETALQTLRIALRQNASAQKALDYLAQDWQENTAAMTKLPDQGDELDVLCIACGELLSRSRLK